MKVNGLLKATVGALMTLTVSTQASLAQDYNWTFQSIWQGGSTNQKVYERFGENIERMSGGRIEVEVLPVGSIVPPSEMLDAVGSNILQGMNGGTAYFVGKDPAFGFLVDLVGAVWDDPQQYEMWFSHGGGLELARELYGNFNVFYVQPVMWGMEAIPTKEPIRTVEEFDGIKIRASEGMNAELWRRLGAGVSSLPGTEVYSALETGKLDATDWGTLGMNDELGYQSVAPYAIYPGLHSMPSADVSINQEVWNSLPDDLKAIVEVAAREMARDSIETNRLLDLQKLEARDPETIISWSDEERLKMRQIAAVMWEEWSTKNELSGRFYDSYMAWLNQIGLL